MAESGPSGSRSGVRQRGLVERVGHPQTNGRAHRGNKLRPKPPRPNSTLQRTKTIYERGEVKRAGADSVSRESRTSPRRRRRSISGSSSWCLGPRLNPEKSLRQVPSDRRVLSSPPPSGVVDPVDARPHGRTGSGPLLRADTDSTVCPGILAPPWMAAAMGLPTGTTAEDPPRSAGAVAGDPRPV